MTSGTTAPSTAVTLEHGPWRMQVRPDLGACISGLWLGDVPVLRSTPAEQLTAVRLSGCYPLVPFSNRLAHAQLEWQGRHYALPQNFPPEPHAIHGVAWQRAWAIQSQTVSSVTLGYNHDADSAWPFAFACTQAFELTEGGLKMTLEITNRSDQPAPAGLGWHPYFVKRPAARLAFESFGRWRMGPDKLPTYLEIDGGIQGEVDQLDVDHCYEGWTGTVQLQDEQLQVVVQSDLPRLVVFTNPSRDFVAIEPVSHTNNAMNHRAPNCEKLGVRILQPQHRWSVHMAVAASQVD